MRRIRDNLVRFWVSGCIGKLVLLSIAILFLLCPCAIFSAIFPTRTPMPTAAIQIQTTQTIPTSISLLLPTATSTAVPTSTPILHPTFTPCPTPTRTPNIGHIGERCEAAGIALTVLSISKTSTINELWQAKKGYTYLVLEVLIENINRHSAPYNPLYFRLKDIAGYEYSTTFAPSPDLKFGELAKGEKVRGYIAFEVPITATGFIVTYQPLVLFGEYLPIRIVLD